MVQAISASMIFGIKTLSMLAPRFIWSQNAACQNPGRATGSRLNLKSI